MASVIQDFVQFSFGGGMNLALDETRIGDNEYVDAFNVRNRFDSLDPIREAVELENAPAGNYQGLYAVGNILILFVSGLAYYKTTLNDVWVNLPTFIMSPTAPTLYAIQVPASTVNYNRESDEDNIEGVTLLLNSKVASTPRALLVQDGINQPVVILPDGTTRVTKTYAQWSNEGSVADSREYVPIGLMMAWHANKLWIVSPNRLKIYQSVTGRPLDFMMNINSDGEKLATEDLGGVDSTSHAVGYNEITAIGSLPSGELFVSTERESFAIELLTERIFGEPKLKNRSLFPVGCVNQFAFIPDILGDAALVHWKGIASFNSILQLKNEAQNAIFSAKIAPAFRNIIQDENSTCIGEFDDYVLFSVVTTYGTVVVVYDKIAERFVSFDIYGIGKIKQFASFVPNTDKIYAITTTNQIYELFSQDGEFLDGQIRFRAVCSNNPKINQKPTEFRVVISGTQEDGTGLAYCYVDGKRVGSLERELFEYPGAITYPANYPVEYGQRGRINNIVYNFTNVSSQGWKMSYRYKWSGGGRLTHAVCAANFFKNEVSLNDASRISTP